MKSTLVALLLTLGFSFNVQAASVCGDLRAIKEKVAAKMDDLDNKIAFSNNKNEIDSYLAQYEKLYNQHQALVQEIADLCMN